MKSAYELAMERLEKTAPMRKLTAAQRNQLAELDSLYAAKFAELDLSFKDQIATTDAAGDGEKAGKLRQQWSQERRRLATELEAKKDRIRPAT
jgi:hypothetical protein